ncbi:hypothetical protein PRVXH_000952 [Proteinivorax hydrogeniformans]|uniref:Core-binding (CB) domain-containing protein n=1 Tax=Proteinivorax hydrogeniformans TaxID=1826727 RepID=A0AAU8HW80_9FIRM
MLSAKYKAQFLSRNNDITDRKYIYSHIQEVENTHGCFTKWNDDALRYYLQSFEATSPNSLHKYVQFLRNLYNYIAGEENIKIAKTYYISQEELFSLIDRRKLNESILSLEQNRYIKNQLTVTKDGIEGNVRDKLIFELAWEGLSNEEIKLIKESDIEFTLTAEEKVIVLLNLKNRVHRIEDEEVVEDIKRCLKETDYYLTLKNGRIRRMKYKESEYLIKPLNVGRGKIEEYLINPSHALMTVFRQNAIICEGINVGSLTVEEIRRSRIIYLLENNYSLETINLMYNVRHSNNLYWLRSIADERKK